MNRPKEGKVAVITGAASGIGAGLAREAVHRGMKIVLADRDEAGLESMAAALGAEVLAIPTDVANPVSVQALAAAVFERHAAIDLLFNNAAVLSTGLSWEIPAERWQQALDINIGGIVNCLRAVVPRMLASDAPARIVNTSSVGGFLPAPLMAAYASTKFAVVALTESIAGELAMLGSKISISLLAPGPVKSGIFREAPPGPAQQFHAEMLAMLEAHGLTPDEFAPLVFAAIDRGDYWIIPQPDGFDDAFAARNALITARTQPQFYQPDKDKYRDLRSQFSM